MAGFIGIKNYFPENNILLDLIIKPFTNSISST